jgi:hypothetical protein
MPPHPPTHLKIFKLLRCTRYFICTPHFLIVQTSMDPSESFTCKWSPITLLLNVKRVNYCSLTNYYHRRCVVTIYLKIHYLKLSHFKETKRALPHTRVFIESMPPSHLLAQAPPSLSTPHVRWNYDPCTWKNYGTFVSQLYFIGYSRKTTFFFAPSIFFV